MGGRAITWRCCTWLVACSVVRRTLADAPFCVCCVYQVSKRSPWCAGGRREIRCTAGASKAVVQVTWEVKGCTQEPKSVLLFSHTMLHTTLRPNVHWAHTSRCMLFPCSLPCQGTAPGDWCAVHTPRGRVVAGVVRGTLAALVFRLVPPSRGSRQLLFRQFTPMHVFVMNAKHLEVRILSFMR